MHTRRIHIANEIGFRPFAYRDALDCSPPFRASRTLARLLRTYRQGQDAPAPRSWFQRLVGKVAA